jgi:hypothetical protein
MLLTLLQPRANRPSEPLVNFAAGGIDLGVSLSIA